MRVTTQSLLADWLDAIAAQKTLIAPKDVDGVLLYRPVQGSADIVWDFTRPVLSAKGVLFPPTERLLTIEQQGQQIRLLEALPEGEQVIFGLRPCDARGLQSLDALFLDHAPVDVTYSQRRRNTTLIGLACRAMGETCFCTSVGGAPDDSTGLDLMLTPLDNGYAVEAVTAKGEALLAGLPLRDVPGEPPPPRLNEPVPWPPVDAWPSRFGDAWWAALAERCLSCRICAYVCPTCRCFDVRDEALAEGNGQGRYERIRCWDSCTGEAYRRIAGGHNPRQAGESRLRNRFFCKFYYYPEQYGPVACTGCGRCIDSCPVNIDITEVMFRVARLAQAEGESST